MGRRLLAGAGSALLTAFRRDPDAPQLVLHGMDGAGRVLVAACPPASRPLGLLPVGSATEVRLDVTLDAAEPGMHLTAASAHLLGVLEWLSDDEGDQLLATARSAACHCAVTGTEPLDSLAELARAPGGRVGVIRAERVVVHDAMGVHAHAIADLLRPEVPGSPPPPVWTAVDRLVAHDAVTALGRSELAALCEGVLLGIIPGQVCSARRLGDACEELMGRVLCVDACPQTVTLMQLGGGEALTVQVRLPGAAAQAHEVAGRLGRLVRDSVASRQPRI